MVLPSEAFRLEFPDSAAVSVRGSELEIASPEEVSAALNAICAAAVNTWRAGDSAAIADLARRLSQHEVELAPSRHAELGVFFGALAKLLGGMEPNRAIQPLVEPFRQGFRAVAADIAGAATLGFGAQPSEEEGSEASPRTQKAPASDAVAEAAATSGPPSPASDWVAALAAHVAAILTARDRETAIGLAGELDKAARQPGMDPDAAAYLMVILGVLRGEDLRRRALTLVEPYRSAYASLQALMRGTDPLEALLESLVHNAGMVARSDHPQAWAGLDAVLQSLADEAEHQALPELARLVGMLRFRLSAPERASSAVADASPRADPSSDHESQSESRAAEPLSVDPNPAQIEGRPSFSDPRLQAAWLKLEETLRSARS